MLQHVVGNGDLIHFWHGNWHPMGPLLPLCSYRLILESGISLDAKLSIVIQDSDWLWPATRSKDMKEIQARLCGQITPSLVAVQVKRLPSKLGIFNVEATWQRIRSQHSNIPWYSLIWFKNHVPKHAFFSWLA